MLLEIFAHFSAKLFESLILAESLRELIIEFRNFLLLQSFDLDLVLECLSSETLLGIVVSIGDRKFSIFVDRRSGEIFGELLQGRGTADFYSCLFGKHRLFLADHSSRE